MPTARGYAAHQAKAPLAPFTFDRRELGPNDIAVQIEYCGVCHSDVHQARDEWGDAIFPMVPGHEIVGQVTAVGRAVKKFRPGDRAGIGVMVDADRECAHCRAGEEQYCPNHVLTYNSRFKSGEPTYGGYSNSIVVDAAFALLISPKLDPAATAPLLCAGVTTWSPLRHWQVGPGKKAGIVGLGGLGHMGLKFASAMGARTVQFTSTPDKAADAIRLGAHEVVLSRDPEEMKAKAGSLDFILDTVSAPHDLNAYLKLLKRDGVLVVVGAPEQAHAVEAFSLIIGRKSLAGSCIGSIRETQEMLDFCAAHNIVSDIEKISIHQINEAFDRVVNRDVRYRFVIDMATLD